MKKPLKKAPVVTVKKPPKTWNPPNPMCDACGEDLVPGREKCCKCGRLQRQVVIE